MKCFVSQNRFTVSQNQGESKLCRMTKTGNKLENELGIKAQQKQVCFSFYSYHIVAHLYVSSGVSKYDLLCSKRPCLLSCRCFINPCQIKVYKKYLEVFMFYNFTEDLTRIFFFFFDTDQ